MKVKTNQSSTKAARPVAASKKTFQCGVCLDSKNCYSKASLCCGHSFCKKCITRWSKTETSCPLCRATFRSYRYRGKITAVKSKRQRQEHGELFSLVVEATTQFLESVEYQNRVLDELIERKSGIDVLVLCIHRSLQILAEEENRENFEAAKLFDALRASENLVRLVRNRSIMV